MILFHVKGNKINRRVSSKNSSHYTGRYSQSCPLFFFYHFHFLNLKINNYWVFLAGKSCQPSISFIKTKKSSFFFFLITMVPMLGEHELPRLTPTMAARVRPLRYSIIELDNQFLVFLFLFLNSTGLESFGALHFHAFCC